MPPLLHVYLTTNRYRQTLVDQDGEPVIGADVTLTLFEANGEEVDGEMWPVTLTDNADGTYDYTPAADLLTLGANYEAVTDADFGGIKAHNSVRIRCREDTS